MNHVFDGNYLNAKDNEFVNKVVDDVESFCGYRHNDGKSIKSISCDYKKASVLLFPPLNPRGRYLLHKTVETYFSDLSTFSVGQEPRRRPLIAWKEHINSEGDNDSTHRQGYDKCRARTSKFLFNSCLSNKTEISYKQQPFHLKNRLPCSRISEFNNISERSANSLHKENPFENNKSRDSNNTLTLSHTDNPNDFNEEIFLENSTVGSEILALKRSISSLNALSDTHNSAGHPSDSTVSDHLTGTAHGHKITRVEPGIQKTTYVSDSKNKLLNCSPSKPSNRFSDRTYSTNRNTLSSDDNWDMSVSTMIQNEIKMPLCERKGRQAAQIYRPPGARKLDSNEYSKKNLPLTENNYNDQQQDLSKHGNLFYINQHQHHSSAKITPTPCIKDEKLKSKRPDQQLYVPRRRRDVCVDKQLFTNCDEMRPSSPADSVCSIVSEYRGRNRYDQLRAGNRYPLYEQDRIINKPPLPLQLKSMNNGEYSSNFINSDNLKTKRDSNNINSHKKKKSSRGDSEKNSRRKNTSSQSPKKHTLGSTVISVQRKEYQDREFADIHRNFSGHDRRRSLERLSSQLKSFLSHENLVKPSDFSNLEDNCTNWRQISGNSTRSIRNKIPVNTTEGFEWRKKSHSNPNTPHKSSTDISKGEFSSQNINCSQDIELSTNEFQELDFNKDKEEHITDGNSLSLSENVPQSCESSHMKGSVQSDFQSRHSSATPVNINHESKTNTDHSVSSPFETSIDDKFKHSESYDLPDFQNYKNKYIDQNNTEKEKLLHEYDICHDTSGNTHLNSNSSLIKNQPSATDGIPVFNISSEYSDHDKNFLDTSSKQNKTSPSLETESSLPSNTNTNIVTETPSEATKSSKETNNKARIDSVESSKPNPKVFSFSWADQVDQAGEGLESWDSLYDDSGNYVLDETLNQKLKDPISEIELHKPSGDYYEYQSNERELPDDDCSNIVEIYDFSATFQTPDLLAIFQQFNGFSLKWVDDTHALGIFSSALTAADCLHMDHPFVKTRPLAEASEASRVKAARMAEHRLPYKPRPETSAALARRLVSGALGLRVRVPKEQRDAERQKLKNAKERRKMVAKQKEDAWEGTLSNLAAE